MFSVIKPDFLYRDISENIAEHDVDVISDLWTMNGRDVYRGSRDPRYTHANVYWLYDEDLQRVGCTEHSLHDHGVFELLWFHDNEFSTLLQEEEWRVENDIWSGLSEQVFNRFVNEEWTTPESFLEQCLYGPFRLVTTNMLIQRPNVYTCERCGRKSLREIAGCTMRSEPLDYPDKAKIVFVDDDLRVYIPPPNSSVFRRLQLGDDSQLPSEQEQVQEEQLEPPPIPLHRNSPQQMLETEERPQNQLEAEMQEQPPRQSRPQTPEQPSGAGEEKHEHM